MQFQPLRTDGLFMFDTHPRVESLFPARCSPHLILRPGQHDFHAAIPGETRRTIFSPAEEAADFYTARESTRSFGNSLEQKRALLPEISMPAACVSTDEMGHCDFRAKQAPRLGRTVCVCNSMLLDFSRRSRACEQRCVERPLRKSSFQNLLASI